MYSSAKNVGLRGENICIVHYLGLLESVAPSKDKIGFAGASKTAEGRSSEERLIELVENAQLADLLHKDSSTCKQVAVHVSKNGFKITDLSTGNVLDRVSLLCIIQCVSYDDGNGNSNVAFLVQKPLSSRLQCYLFQTKSMVDADHICTLLRQAFTAAVNSVTKCH